jgi:O-methyltransferase
MNSYFKRLIRPVVSAAYNIPPIEDLTYRSIFDAHFRRWCEANPCPTFHGRSVLYQHVYETQGLDGPIDYLEFGVFEGAAMRWWVGKNRDPSSTFHGFDTFEGLPSDWDGTPAGSFSAGGKAPDMDDSRCRFIRGLFQETLPGWIAGRAFHNRIVLHLDADLYNSTLLALIHLLPHVKPGDILVFDEFSNYMHEYRAFLDAKSVYPRNFTALCNFDRNGEPWAGVALRAD